VSLCLFYLWALIALLRIENLADLKEAHRKWTEEALKQSKVVRDSK